jgi:hypothetical protein
MLQLLFFLLLAICLIGLTLLFEFLFYADEQQT